MQQTIKVDTKARTLSFVGQTMACAIGRSGACAAADKREGDGFTPRGIYPLRWVYARPDRVHQLETKLPVLWLKADDGWCDAVDDKHYNQPVRHPYPASAEHLWRDDGLYDVVVVLGHNDDPVIPGLGSAIFLHCCIHQPDGSLKPTQGCVAIDRIQLVEMLARCETGTMIEIG